MDTLHQWWHWLSREYFVALFFTCVFVVIVIPPLSIWLVIRLFKLKNRSLVARTLSQTTVGRAFLLVLSHAVDAGEFLVRVASAAALGLFAGSVAVVIIHQSLGGSLVSPRYLVIAGLGFVGGVIKGTPEASGGLAIGIADRRDFRQWLANQSQSCSQDAGKTRTVVDEILADHPVDSHIADETTSTIKNEKRNERRTTHWQNAHGHRRNSRDWKSDRTASIPGRSECRHSWKNYRAAPSPAWHYLLSRRRNKRGRRQGTRRAVRSSKRRAG